MPSNPRLGRCCARLLPAYFLPRTGSNSYAIVLSQILARIFYFVFYRNAREENWKARFDIAFRVIAVILLACATNAAYASLGSSITQNAITVTQNFSSVYFVDTKTSPYPTGFYAVYNVTNNSSSDLADVWVTVGNFTGSTVYLSLGGNDTGAAHLGTLAAGTSKPAYFYMSVDCSSFTSGHCSISNPQGFTADVYLGPPTGNLLASLTTNDITVAETIAASANKVNSGSVSTTTPSMGSTFSVVVNGSTGTIGSTSTFALSPQTSTTFPADSFQLVKTSLTFSNGGSGTYTDLLQIPTSVIAGIASADYTVTYTYRVTGTTSGTTTIQPVSYIDSGGQTKHTTIASLANIPPIQPASNSLLLSMSTSPTSLGLSGGTVTYTVHITNSGSTASSLDEFIDALASAPAAEDVITGSSTFAGNHIADPTINGSTLIWSGVFTVPAGGSADFTFQTLIPATTGTYTDYFYGLVSAAQIDTTYNTSDDAEATTSVTVSSQQSTTIQIANLPGSGTYGGGFTPTYAYAGDGTPSVSSQSASICVVTSGVVHYVGIGVCSLKAAATAGTHYSATTGSTQTFNVGQATPTVSISNQPASGTYGGSFTPTFSYTGDGTTSVSSNSTSICTVASGVVNFIGVGTCSLTASATAGTNYASVTGTAQTFSVGKATPTISISNQPASGTYGGSFTPTFSYTGDGATSVSSNSTSICTVTSGVVNYIGVGTCSLTASATAGTNYASVTGTAQTFSVGKAAPAISISNQPASGTYGGSFTPTFSYTGDGATSVSSNSTSICTVTSGVVHYVGIGTCSLTASATAGTNYTSVTGTAQTFSVGKATPTISISNQPASGTYGGSFTPTFSYTGDGTTSVSSNSTSICTVTSGVVNYIGVGTCSLTASATAGTNYTSVTGTAQTFSVGKATPTISISNQPASGTYGGSFTPTFSYTGDGTTSVSSNSTSICTVVSGVVNYVGVGTCSLTASATAGTNYTSATGTAQTFSVGKATATVALSGLTQTYTGTQRAATATTTPSGLTVNLIYTGTGSTVYGASSTAPTEVGTYAVTATINDTNYDGSNSGTLTVSQATATVSISNLQQTYTGFPLGVTVTTTPASLAVTTSYTGTGSTSYGPSTVAPTSVGTYSVTSTVNNANYQGSHHETFTISQSAQQISFTQPPTPIAYGAAPIVLSATGGNSGNAVQFSLVSGPGQLNGNMLSFLGVGTVTVAANQAGNANYAAAAEVRRSIVVLPANLGFSANGLSFGSYPVGQTSATQTILLSNPNNSAVALTSISATGDFSAASACTAIPAGGSCTVNVSFTPASLGARSGALVIAGAQSGSPQSIQLSGTGTSAGISITPSTLTFGGQIVSSTSLPQTITIANTGTADLVVTNIVSTGDFSVTNNCGTVPANSSCSLIVTFTPTATGNRTGTITFTDNFGSGTQTQEIRLSGTGTAAGAVLTPSVLNSPDTLVGATSFGINAALTNTGTAALTNIAVSTAGDYTQTNNCASTLAAGGSCTIRIQFAPTVAGANTGSLNVTDSLGTQTAVLTGTGLAPGASLSTAQLIFGGQQTGTTSQAQTVVFTNSGNTSVNVSSISTGTNFIETDNCIGAVAAGASCSINVSFAPTATGALSTSVVVNTNAGTRVITAQGQGVAPGLGVLPAFLIFGAEQVGSSSRAQTVAVTNTGSTTLTLNPVVISSNFTASSQCATIAPGASCLVSVAFAPASTGSIVGALVLSDSQNQVSTQVTLSGQGALPGIAAAPSNLNFGSVPVGKASEAQTITVTNNGTGDLHIGAITATGDFTETDTCKNTTLSVGATCVISVSMAATTIDTRTGQIQIVNSADGVHTIALSGVGQQAGVTIYPTSLAFGSRPYVSSTQATSTTGTLLSVNLTNSGNVPLSFNGATITGDFYESDSCGTSIAVGASCTLSVRFVPTALGHRTGLLTIRDNAGGGTQTVTLEGEGSPGGLVLTPPTLDFGVQTIGQTSTVHDAKLTNNTGAALSNLALVASGEFAETDDCGATLVNGASCTLHITVTPQTAGSITGAVTVTSGGTTSSSGAVRAMTAAMSSSNSASSVGLVAVKASAVPPGVGLSIPKLSFSVTSVGSPSAGQTLTLTNTGTGLSLTGLVIDGTNITEFPFTTTCGATLAAQQSCTITVRFIPVATGQRNGSMLITADGGISASLPLDGTSVAPATQLAFVTRPAASLIAGGNAGASVTVNELDTTGTSSTGYNDTVTLTVTGPSGYQRSYTATAASSIAVFNLSGTALTAAGSYTYTAAVTGNSSIGLAVATEVVTSASAATVAVTAGNAQSAVIHAAFGTPLSVLVSDLYGNPVGGATVTFSTPGSGASGVLAVASVTTNASGSASTGITANGTAGNYNVQATVSSATSVSFTFTNMAAPTAMVVSSSAARSTFLSSITLTATVSSVAGVPTGTVTFNDGATPLGTVAVVAGVATINTSTIAARTHSITAVYAGDGNYAASTAAAVDQVVVDFTLATTTTDGAAQDILPGATAHYALALTPTNGNSMPLATTLTVTGLPAGATPTLSPAAWTQLTATSWQLAPGIALSNLALGVTVPGQTAHLESSNSSAPLLLCLLLLPCAVKLRRSGRNLSRWMVWLLAALFMGTAFVGCGTPNGFFGQKPQSYTLTVTATTGNLNHSTQLTLKVE